MALRERLTDAERIGHALDVIPDIGQLQELLAISPGEQLADAIEGRLPAPQPAPPLMAGDELSLAPEGVPIDLPVDLPPEVTVPQKPSRRFVQEQTFALGEAAQSALVKIQRDGTNAQLDEDEKFGLETVVSVFGRPAIPVEGGRFRQPTSPWEHLEQHRPAIEGVLRSVGRIEVEGHPEHDCVGTGFLVAPDVVMTNRHVAKEFIALSGPPWRFEPGMTARIDFNEELFAAEPREYEITEVIAFSAQVDMALLRVATANGTGQPLPPPLLISGTTFVTPDSDVYVVGYPLYERIPRIDADTMNRIFGGVYGIKRVQPGKVRSFVPGTRELVHDCSTLGGNSGSCVVDLQTGAVVGLHRRGVYLEGNFAVALARVRDDPALKAAQVQFSQ